MNVKDVHRCSIIVAGLTAGEPRVRQVGLPLVACAWKDASTFGPKKKKNPDN